MKKLILLTIIVLDASSIKAQILYTDLVPDSTIYAPAIIDSGNSMAFDINHDSILDFSLCTYHHYEFGGQTCCDCYENYYYSTNTILFAFYDTISLAYDPCIIARLDSGEVINEQRFHWGGSSSFNYYCPPDMINCSQPTNFKYYPVKYFNSGNYCYGWIRLQSNTTHITMMDMALNLIPNEPIIAGSISAGLGIINASTDYIKVFPNPSDGWVTLQITDTKLLNKGVRLKVFNMVGESVLDISHFKLQTTNEIDLSNILKGMYFLQIITSKEILTNKIVIQ